MNIGRILKNLVGKSVKLYSPMCGECILMDVNEYDYSIGVINNSGANFRFYNDGRYISDGECLLFPSKEHRDWKDWQLVIFPQLTGWLLSCGKGSFWNWLITKEGLFPFMINSKIAADIVAFEDFNWDNPNIVFATDEEVDEFFEVFNEMGYKFGDGKVHKKEWSIYDAKEGAFILDMETNAVFIFKCIEDGEIKRYASYFIDDNLLYYSGMCENDKENYCGIEEIDYMRPANQQEIDILISHLRTEKDLNWDPINKKLYKTHIVGGVFLKSNFKPYDKVIVRNNFECADNWAADLFSHYDENEGCYCTLGGCSWDWCLPYNEETAYLIGTDKEYDGPYKTWVD